MSTQNQGKSPAAQQSAVKQTSSVTPSPKNTGSKLKTCCLRSCLGCFGIFVISIVAIVAIGNWARNQTIIAIEKGNTLWKEKKTAEAVARYREADYGDSAGQEQATHATIYQRCIEYEWSKGNTSAAVVLIDRALEKELPIQFQDEKIQAAVTQGKIDVEARRTEKTRKAEERAAAREAREDSSNNSYSNYSIPDLVSGISGCVNGVSEQALWHAIENHIDNGETSIAKKMISASGFYAGSHGECKKMIKALYDKL